jgi:ERCC4-type nuclease
MIIEDTREKKGFSQCEMWTLETSREKLDFGDYTNGVVYVERKSIPDLVNSVGLVKNWKRLQAEMGRFKEHQEITGIPTTMFLVIEGTQIDMADEIVKRKRHILPSTIISRLCDLAESYDIEVVWNDDREMACALTINLLTGE